jgi:hypothetical protein
MRKAAPRRLKRDAAEAGYTHWLHFQGCASGYDGHGCSGPIQAAHLRSHTGLSRKEPAEFQTHLCEFIHTQFDQRRGPFDGWTEIMRFAWFMRHIVSARANWLALPEKARAEWLTRAMLAKREP